MSVDKLIHLSKMLAELTVQMSHARQPQVDKDLMLLVQGHEHDGMQLDLYGENDAPRGYIVSDVTLTGSKASLRPLISVVTMSSFGQWCDDNLPSAHELADRAIEDARHAAYVARRL